MNDPILHAGDTILTYSGHYLNVFDPNPDHICIEDIAHALSHIPRFAGHLEKVVSVAEHSIKVMLMVDPAHRLEALLHDASEAYLMDIPKPIKRHLPDYQKLENRLMEVIAAKFGFSFPMSEQVKKADRDRLEYEHKALRIEKGLYYYPWTALEAKKRFIEIYRLLTEEVTNG